MLGLSRWLQRKHSVNYFNRVIGTGTITRHDIIKRIMQLDHYDMVHRNDPNVARHVMRINHYHPQADKHLTSSKSVIYRGEIQPILSRRRDGVKHLEMLYNVSNNSPIVKVIDEGTELVYLKYIRKFMNRYQIYNSDINSDAYRNFSKIVINGTIDNPTNDMSINKMIMNLLIDIVYNRH